jgi:pilus assembly protein Flp/PilA
MMSGHKENTMLSIYVFVETLRARIAEKAEEGQGLAEYGLILALVAVVAITALSGLGTAIIAKLGQVTNAL